MSRREGLPLVSVIIPAHDAGPYLNEAIESVFAQEYSEWELIVCNDASTDDTPALALAWQERHPERVRVITNAQCTGVSLARDRAIAAAGGGWLALLDADDLWMPGKLRLQMELAGQGHQWVSGLTEAFWSPEIPPAERHRVPMTQPLPGGASAALLARSVYEAVGAFDENYRHAEWIEWSLRAVDRGFESVAVEEVVVRRRLHRENKSRQAASARLTSLKASLDRRRTVATPES